MGTKALPIAKMKDLRERMSMGWQPDTGDAVHEEDKGIAAPRAMKLVARYHLEKATRMVMVLSALQTVHGAVQNSTETPVEESEEGNKIL